jgi:adiponectin receptor
MSNNSVITDEEVSTHHSEKTWINNISQKIKHYIGPVHEAPDHTLDNEYILKGYRVNFETCCAVNKSICMCHNETVNVWSHLLGALTTLYFIVATVYMGTYDDKINSQQIGDINRIKNDFNNYSEPFYTAKPYLHNLRLILDDLSNSTLINDEHVKMIKPGILYFDMLYISIEDKYNKKEIDCLSCITDFTNKVYALNAQVSLIKINVKIDTNATNILDDFQKSCNNIISLINKKANTLKELYNIDNIENDNDEKFYLPRWPIYVQLACAMVCLLCSSTFHLYSAYSQKLSNFLNRLDYAGISILIAGSCYPPYYYMFYCNQSKIILT